MVIVRCLVQKMLHFPRIQSIRRIGEVDCAPQVVYQGIRYGSAGARRHKASNTQAGATHFWERAQGSWGRVVVASRLLGFPRLFLLFMFAFRATSPNQAKRYKS